MAIPTERIAEESEDGGDTDDTTSSVEDTDPSHRRRSLVDMISLDYTRSRSVPPSPAHTRSHGKAKKEKDREPFYKGFEVVYLPGDINGLTKKLHLLAAEFFEW